MKRAVLIALAFALVARPALASPRDVVLIGGGPAFQNAVSVALGAWSLHVVTTDAAAPPVDVTRAAKEARVIVDRYGAAGVVWIASRDHEHALLVYDAETDQLVSRVLSRAPPFDAPTAAAAALSVKTLLRSSTVAPLAERIGAPAAESAPPPEAPVVVAPSRSPEPPARPPITIEIGGAVRA